MKTDEQKIKGFKEIYNFVLGRIHSHRRPRATHGPRVARMVLDILQITIAPVNA